MGAFRTLLRRNLHYGEKLDDDGGLIARPKRTKPGTPNRRILFEDELRLRCQDGVHRYERRFHATKGWRVQRVPL